MIEAKRIFYNLINLALSAFLSFSLIYALTSSLIFEYKPYQLLLAGFILTCIWYIVFYNKLSLKITGVVIGASIVAGAIFLAVTRRLVRLALELSSFCTWIFDYVQGYDTLNKLYQPYLALIVCTLVTLATYFFTIKKFNFLVLLAGGIAIFSVQWMYNIFESYLSFYTFLLFILIYYFIHIFNKFAKRDSNGYVNKSVFSLWMLPVSLVVVLVCLTIPTKSTPIQFPWLDKKINSFYKYVTNAYKNYKSFEFFSIESTGFGENSSRLGGKVKLDKTLVMKVEAPKVVYLRGSSKEIYNGTRWTNIEKKQSPINNNQKLTNNELYEMYLGLRLLTDEQDAEQKYLPTIDVKVSYKNLLMKTIFAPTKTYSLDFNNKSYQAFIDRNAIVSSKNISTKNFQYKLKAYNMDLKNKEFINLLKQSKPGIYDNILKKIDLINNSLIEKHKKRLQNIDTNNDTTSAGSFPIYYNLTLEELKWILNNNNTNNLNDVKLPSSVSQLSDYYINEGMLPAPSLGHINTVSYDALKQLSAISKNVYATYLQLPEKLPSRVSNLAASITSSKKTSYDKVKAIEDYLSKNYSYTLTPKLAPRHRDFVDYFLFETKEGYCTYYATAMTIMVRSLGIPARYVEGYILPPSPKTGSTYEVTNENAHAWVEVYFDGFGWIPFEPTAPFRSTFYNGEQSTAKFSENFAANAFYEEYLKHLRGYGNMNLNMNYNSDGVNASKKVNKRLYYIIGAVILVSLLILALIALIVYNMFNTRYKIFKMKKMDPRDSILHMYKYYVNVLSALGYPIKPGETPVQYGQRVDSYIIFNKPNTFRAVTDKFLVARYSTNKMNEKDKQLVYEFYDKIVKEAKDELGKISFFIKRFLLGKI